MSTYSRLYLLSKLTEGERTAVERLEADVRRAIVTQHAARAVEYVLPSHASEQAARTLMELYAAAGWQASLARGNGLMLVLKRAK